MALPTPLMLDPAMLADSSLVHPEDDDDSEYEYEYHPTETEVRSSPWQVWLASCLDCDADKVSKSHHH